MLMAGKEKNHSLQKPSIIKRATNGYQAAN